MYLLVGTATGQLSGHIARLNVGDSNAMRDHLLSQCRGHSLEKEFRPRIDRQARKCLRLAPNVTLLVN